MYFSGRVLIFDLNYRPNDEPAESQINERSRPNSHAAQIVLKAEYLPPSGLLFDTGTVNALGDYLRERLSEHITKVFDLPLTDERLARHIYAWCAEYLPPPIPDYLVEVRVSKGPTAWASYGIEST